MFKLKKKKFSFILFKMYRFTLWARFNVLSKNFQNFFEFYISNGLPHNNSIRNKIKYDPKNRRKEIIFKNTRYEQTGL